jgi:hypothetical protein
LVLLIFNNKKESKLYGPIKKYLTMMKVPSQVLFAFKTGSVAVCGKVMVQMAAKIGITTWSVPTTNPFWKKKLVTVGAISIIRNTKLPVHNKLSKEEKKRADELNRHEFLVALVGTSDAKRSKTYSKTVVAS